VFGAAACLAVNAVFFVEVVAPRVLRLPYHHCPYDLLPRAPESVTAAVLFLGSAFAVGWAAVVGWLGLTAESRPFVPGMVGRLLTLALIGHLAALGMVSVQLVLA
jgi:hypothetical protein